MSDADQERAAIVAWLLDQYTLDGIIEMTAQDLVAAIESGAHLDAAK
jgi:hypothetical protein